MRQKSCLKRLMRDGRGEEKAGLSLPWSAGLRAASGRKIPGVAYTPRIICSYSGWFGYPRHPLDHRNIIKGSQQTRRSIRPLAKQSSAPVLDSWCPPVNDYANTVYACFPSPLTLD